MRCDPTYGRSVSGIGPFTDVSLRTGAAIARGAGVGFQRRSNWLQLIRFCTVGTSGYGVNLTVYAALVLGPVHFLLAAACAFCVAVTNNYTWNRLWTFGNQRGAFAYQGFKFFVVSVLALGLNLAVLALLVQLGFDKIPAQALAVVLVTPVSFLGNKLWSFRL